MKKRLEDKHIWKIDGGKEDCFHEWPQETFLYKNDLLSWKCPLCTAIQSCEIIRNVECEPYIMSNYLADETDEPFWDAYNEYID